MNHEKIKIVCIGHASYDVTLPLDGFPIENTKIRISDRVECGGGPACTAAYLLGKWGCDVTFFGVVGSDKEGSCIKKELDEASVCTNYLEMNDDYETPIGYVIANIESGTRTILTTRYEKQMKKITIDFVPDIILMDGQEYEFSKYLVETYREAITVIDASRVTDEVLDLASLCDYLVCSRDFAEQVTGIKVNFDDMCTLEQLYLKMQQKFSNHIVITLEQWGCLYKEENQLFRMPSIFVKAIDSTGAGDIFHGAFVYGLSKKYPMELILKGANVAGVLSTQKIGSRYSIPTREEVHDYVPQFK